MAIENYDDLFATVERNIAETIQTNNFNVGKFLQEMEQGFIAHGFREDDESNFGVENILITEINAVGDFILTSPVIRELRRNYLFANITLVVTKSVYPMAERCPYVNEVLAFDLSLDTQNILEIIQKTADFAKKYLWRRRFKLAFEFRYFAYWKLPHLFMTYMSGAKNRIGYLTNSQQIYFADKVNFDNDMSKIFLTHCYVNPGEIISNCARNLYLLSVYGLKIVNTNAELYFDDEDKFRAKRILEGFAQNKIKIIIGIGANHPSRKYPVEKYLQAFKKIVKKGAALIIMGGTGEKDDARFLQENLPADSVLNLVDVPTGWRVDSAVTALADMYIGNDTGTLHVSAANHLPVIYLSRVAKDRRKVFQTIPTECEIYFPWQTKTILIQPDHQLGECAKIPAWEGCLVQDSHCITQINPDEIVAAYDTMAKIIKSDIKEIKCPPVIRSINPSLPLYADY